MRDSMNSAWGPWHRHPGGGIPVPAGTIVEVITLEPTRDGVSQKVGVAGQDLTRSWEWTPDTRATHPAAPIDFYRVKKAKGLRLLEGLVAGLSNLERA